VTLRLPDTVARCYSESIRHLSVDSQSAMHTLSLFGASASSEYLTVLESDLNVRLIEPLENAVKSGLVYKMNGQFHFCHDGIQGVSFDIIVGEVRQRNHLMCGRCLIKLYETSQSDELSRVRP
jgi:predicted ATPase